MTPRGWAGVQVVVVVGVLALVVSVLVPAPVPDLAWLHAGAVVTDEVPYRSSVADIAVVVEEMDLTLADLERDGDDRVTFLAMYAAMTVGTADAIAAGGPPVEGGSGAGMDRFDDGAWVRALLVRFADYYFAAFDAAEAGDAGRVPPAWQESFDAASEGGRRVLADALLGMNAHINYDLALATRDLLAAEVDATGHDVAVVAARRSADFVRVDAVIASVIGPALAAMATDPAATRALDRAVFSRPDLAGRWADAIAAWRADAWALAVDLVGAGESSSLRRVRHASTGSRNWASVIVGVDEYLEAVVDRPGAPADALLEDPMGAYRVIRAANRSGVAFPDAVTARQFLLGRL